MRLLNPSRQPLGMSLLAALVVSACFCALVWYELPFLSDDALISLRYAQRLVAGHGLTWTDGEVSEGYSDLLWVLIQAALQALGVEPVAAARVSGFVGTALALIAVSVPARRDPAALAARVLSGGLLLATSLPLAVWAIGGLEQGFLAGVLAVGLWPILRDVHDAPGRRWGALALAAVALLRLDGAAFAGLTAIGVLIWARAPRPAVEIALPTALALTGQQAFRLAVHGAAVPNTALAKVAFGWDRVSGGLEHVARGWLAGGVAVALAVIATAWLVRRSGWTPRIAIPWTLWVGWTAYVALVGGDIFPGWRQLVAAYVPLAFLVADAGEAALPSLPRTRVAIAIAALVAAHLGVQLSDSENQRAKRERWEFDGIALGKLLRRGFSEEQPLLAVDAAGAIPFYAELPALDMLGLNDRYIATHPPEQFGGGVIGHELGDGDYVWSRRPDLIAFNGGSGGERPLFTSGRQLTRKPGFGLEYGLVRFKPAGLRAADAPLYVRRGGELGPRSTASGIEIQAYWFASSKGLLARLDDRGWFVEIGPDQPKARAAQMPIPAGTWRVEADPPGPVPNVRCNASERGTGSEDVVAAGAPFLLDIDLHVDEPGQLRAVRLIPTDEAPGRWCDTR